MGNKMTKKIQNELHDSKEFLNALNWEDKEKYANFLAQTYYFVRHSTRLLCAAMAHFKDDRDTLFNRFKAHLQEEDAHEKIALSDLKKLGYSIDDFEESAFTRAFYETQYYRIQESKGISLLGYILYLEAIASFSQDVGERLYECYGKSKSQFVKIHVEEDPEHVEKAFASIDSLPESERNLVYRNFFDTSSLYKAVLNDVFFHGSLEFSMIA